MTTPNPDDLFFDPNESITTLNPNVRLIRFVFNRLGITNGIFVKKYHDYLVSKNTKSPSHLTDNYNVRTIATYRRFILNPRALGGDTLLRVMKAMGCVILDHSFGEKVSSVIFIYEGQKFELASSQCSTTRTQVAKAEARRIWLEGYRRALANVVAAPVTFDKVMVGEELEEQFENWYTGKENY